MTDDIEWPIAGDEVFVWDGAHDPIRKTVERVTKTQIVLAGHRFRFRRSTLDEIVQRAAFSYTNRIVRIDDPNALKATHERRLRDARYVVRSAAEEFNRSP